MQHAKTMPPKRKHGGAGQSPQKVKTEPGAEYHFPTDARLLEAQLPSSQVSQEEADF